MFFRNRRLVRAIACLLLLETLGSLALPSVTWAMSGPSQPEFTSYGSPDASDMVNLSTGDFSYSLPILDIPGPERGFSLPLTYKAGIELEQEASWVGLGWSLNAGAIARSVNGYADDANNEPVQMTFNKKIDRGWTGGIPGVIDMGWNSITGHKGSVDLLGLASVGWNNSGINQGDLVGIGYKAGSGLSVDPIRMASAVVTIATMGGGSTLSLAANVGIQVASSVAIGAGISAAGLGHLSGMASFNNEPTRDVQNHTFYDNYWNYYNNTTTENAFGSLYFGKMSQNTTTMAYNVRECASFTGRQDPPTISYGSQSAASTYKLFNSTRDISGSGNSFSETAADIYQDGTIRRDKDLFAPYGGGTSLVYEDYKSALEVGSRPISIAHDYFSVMGESVSGPIRPYRLEVGSIANPKLSANVFHDPEGHYYLTHAKYMVVPFLDDYKVDFRYENSLANGYDHHRYTAPAGSDATGLVYSLGANNSSNYSSQLNIADTRLITDRTGTARKGLHNAAITGNAPQMDRKFVQGKNITWYSNAEISAMYATSTDGAGNGFLEFEHPTVATEPGGKYTPDRQTYNPYRTLAPPSGIGAFAITSEDGTTYHYSLPVYQYTTYSESNEKQQDTTIGELGKSTRLTGGGPSTLVSYRPISKGTAISWLLTAITSADYIDRNNSGTVDAADWGGWVKFEYGKMSDRYKWRQPYIGGSYSDESSTINQLSFTEGYKETYYLNTISTRTHTALFVKSVRQDGRGHFRPGITSTVSKLGIDEQLPASSLRLDEIILLDNPTLNKLRTADGIRATSDPNAVPALTNATGSAFAAFADDPMTGSGDFMNRVLDTHDLDGDSRIQQYVRARALKRIHFNYSYDLCRGVPNSFACTSGQTSSLPLMDEANISTSRGGKLTLRSVSFFGPTVNNSPTKITPDFTFGYESPQAFAYDTNPSYGKEKWDAFGMFLESGKADVRFHRPSQYGYSAPWSLTKITSPLGGITDIKYERDQYAHVSEYGTSKVHLSNTNCSNTFNATFSGGGALTSILKPKQTIYVTGVAKYYDCDVTNSSTGDSYKAPIDRYYNNQPFEILSVSGTQVTLSSSPSPNSRTYNPCHMPITAIGSDFDFVLSNNVVGGDVRVESITVRDDVNSYKVKYIYTAPNPDAPTEAWCNSTGVIAKEPTFLERFEHPISAAYDYPTTPVIYSQVTVLRGLFRNNLDTDFETREVYSFYTPTSSMVSESSPNWLANNGNGPNIANNQSTIDVGKIGQPRKIEIFNSNGLRELSTDFDYASTIRNADGLSGQGHYTEGVLNHENAVGYKFNRSTKEYVPSVMIGSRSTRNGVTISNSNVLYDFYTGQVLETAFTNALGKVYHSRSIPAYTLPGNAGMGAKGDNNSNSHMLTQQGAFYTYTEVLGGPAYNPLNPLNPQTSRILDAGVQTWQKDWSNYREPDAAGVYQDVNGQKAVWREAATYTWQSPILAADGSLQSFVPFNWTGTSDSRWLKSSETVRYDHYSHGLESRDINGDYLAQKTGYGQTQIIASAANARYSELANSSAEDPIIVNGSTHFGGEIIAGGIPDMSKSHTGFYSLQLAANQKGFKYQALAGRDVDLGKPYRISAWVNANPGTTSKLYVMVNGTRLAENMFTITPPKKAGDWYLLNSVITLPASASNQNVEFGCINDGTAVVNFDDFRVMPFTATVTSQVYDPRANWLLYKLDNDNFFTRYDYSPTGQLKTVYQEVLDQAGYDNSMPAKKVKEYEYNFAQLYLPTWVTTMYSCKTDNNGNNTGIEQRYVTDINPFTSPAVSGKWEDNGAASQCIPRVCPNSDPIGYSQVMGPFTESSTSANAPTMLYQNVCRTGTVVSSSTNPTQVTCASGSGSQLKYVWTMPDGSTRTSYSSCRP
jgi:hypothetical protein